MRRAQWYEISHSISLIRHSFDWLTARVHLACSLGSVVVDPNFGTIHIHFWDELMSMPLLAWVWVWVRKTTARTHAHTHTSDHQFSGDELIWTLVLYLSYDSTYASFVASSLMVLNRITIRQQTKNSTNDCPERMKTKQKTNVFRVLCLGYSSAT